MRGSTSRVRARASSQVDRPWAGGSLLFRLRTQLLADYTRRWTNLGLPRLQLTRRVGWSGRVSGEVECLVLDRGESAETTLPPAAVVGPFDPGDDRQA